MSQIPAKIRIFTAAVLLALPAAAQDLIYTDGPIEQCVFAAQSGRAALECVGLAAAACMTRTPGGSSTAAMTGCADLELRYWDDMLNQVYQRQRRDAAANDMQSSGPSSAEALRDMQRAWIPFRDARCAYEASQWGGGTGAGPAYVGCLMNMTAEQALYLTYAGIGN